jgi:hypothetical protein
MIINTDRRHKRPGARRRRPMYYNERMTRRPWDVCRAFQRRRAVWIALTLGVLLQASRGGPSASAWEFSLSAPVDGVVLRASAPAPRVPFVLTHGHRPPAVRLGSGRASPRFRKSDASAAVPRARGVRSHWSLSRFRFHVVTVPPLLRFLIPSGPETDPSSR